MSTKVATHIDRVADPARPAAIRPKDWAQTDSDVDDVAEVRDAAQLGADLGHGLAADQQAVGGQDVGQQLGGRHHASGLSRTWSTSTLTPSCYTFRDTAMELRDDTRPLTRPLVVRQHPARRPPVPPARRGPWCASGALFGIAEGTARTALSRMVAAGELVADDGGYALAGPLLERQARQDAAGRRLRLVGRATGSWPSSRPSAGRPADRAALRAGHAAAPPGRAARRRVAAARTTSTRSALPDAAGGGRRPVPGHHRPTRATAVAGPALGPRRLGGTGRALRTELDGPAAAPRAERRDVLAPGLRAVGGGPPPPPGRSARCPPSCCPPTWPGPRLRAVYERYDAAFKAAWATASR